MEAITRSLTPQVQQPTMCGYCGNKVDINDSTIDANLQEMRDNLHNLALNNNLKRTSAKRSLIDGPFGSSGEDSRVSRQ
jgi:hypothetical protein